MDYGYSLQLHKTMAVAGGSRFFVGTAGSKFQGEDLFPHVQYSGTGNVPSCRLYSSIAFSGGVFALEVFHMPSGYGVWPAWWLGQDSHQTMPAGLQPDWPADGEIDIIEAWGGSTSTTSLHIGGFTSRGLVPHGCEYNQTMKGCQKPGCFCPAGSYTGQCSSNAGSADCPRVRREGTPGVLWRSVQRDAQRSSVRSCVAAAGQQS